MKPFSFLAVLFFFLLMGNKSFARKDVGEYWNSVMKDQPMPESIRDLFDDDRDDQISTVGSTKRGHFVKDFDVRPSAIIYQMSHSSQHPGQGDHGDHYNNKPSIHENPHEVLRQVRRG